MEMKRSLLQVIALLLGAISLVNCSGSPSCVLEGASSPRRLLTPAATATGCPTGGGGGGTCSSTLTPTDVLFGQGTTGAITTLAINTPVGTNLSLMCTTATATLGEMTVANVTATNKNFLYTMSTSAKTATIDGFAIGHVAPVTLTSVSVGAAFTFTGTSNFISLALQADPSGRFLTVTDISNNAVHMLLIDPNLGTLTEAAGSPFSVPNALFTAVATTGAFLYVSDQSDGQIFIFSIDVTANPALVQIVNSPFLASNTLANSPIFMQPNLAGTFMYTANSSSISFFTINPDGSLSGTGSPLSFVPEFDPQLLTLDNTGTFLYALGTGTEGILGFTMGGTGALTLISNTSFGGGLSVTDMLVNPLGGQMYLLIAGTINVYTLNPQSGLLTPPTGTSTFKSSSLNLAAARVQ
jgi:hypothetical protein